MTPDTKTRVRKALLGAGGQLALVVVGILIALQVDNWNDARKQSARRQVLLQKVRTELQANAERVRAAQAKRARFLEQLQQRSKAWSDQERRKPYMDMPESERVSAWPGMAPVDLDAAVFDTAKSTGLLADVEPEFFAQLSRTYARIATTNRIGQNLMNQVFQISYDTRTGDAVRLFWRIQEEFFGAQQLLLPTIDDVVRKIASIAP